MTALRGRWGRRACRALLVGGLAVASLALGAPAHAAAAPPVRFHPGRYVYVTNSGANTVSMLNALTDTVAGVVTVGSHPRAVAVSADGTRAYVANFLDGQARGTLSVLNTRTGLVAATVRVGIGPVGVAVSPDGLHAYVANRGDGFSDTSTLSIVDTRTAKVTGTVQVGGEAAGVALSADGTQAYVANTFGFLSVIGLVSGKRSVIQVGPKACCFASSVAVAAVGGRGYVTSGAPDFTNAQVLSVFATATNKVVDIAARLPAEGDKGIAVAPNGRRVYVSSGARSIVVLDGRDGRVVRTLTVPAAVSGLAVSATGLRLFAVSGATNSVFVLDTVAGRVVDTIHVGLAPRGIAFGTLPLLLPVLGV